MACIGQNTFLTFLKQNENTISLDENVPGLMVFISYSICCVIILNAYHCQINSPMGVIRFAYYDVHVSMYIILWRCLVCLKFVLYTSVSAFQCSCLYRKASTHCMMYNFLVPLCLLFNLVAVVTL